MFDSLKEWLAEFLESAFKGFDDAVLESIDLLKGHSFLFGEMMQSSERLKSVCYTIAGICMLIELIQITSRVDVLKWEHGLKIGIKLVISVVCIDKAPLFLEACYKQALAWIEMYEVTYLTMATYIGQTITFKMADITGMGNILGLFTTLIIVALGVKVCGLVIQMICYARMFELYCYCVISPLPCAFLPLGNGNSEGLSINGITSNFLKSYIGACMQGVMIFIAFYIYRRLQESESWAQDFFNLASNHDLTTMSVITEISFFMLLKAIILVMAVSKCSSWAKSMINAM